MAMNLEKGANVWLSTFSLNAAARIRLICFPYAGGNASLFRAWSAQLPPYVELCAVQLPGHGHRILETPSTNLPNLVGEIGAALTKAIETPYAFFGHSLGAILSFEVARWLRDRGLAMPRHLFVSGRRAPQCPNSDLPVYNASDEVFIASLAEMKGTPRAVLDDPEMLAVVLPILRADFELGETYVCDAGAPLPCPITVFAGSDDREGATELVDGWQAQTTGAFATHTLKGDHFFLHESERELLMLLSTALLTVTREMPPVSLYE